jgi:hypothetical protein
MPFATSSQISCPPPLDVDWGSPKGRLIHIEVDPKKEFAYFVIEKSPEKFLLKIDANKAMYGFRGKFSHFIYFPWRYYVIRVRWDTRVCGVNPGILLMTEEKITDMGTVGVFRVPYLPNVFESGSLCLGYTVSFRDRSHVRSAFRTIRYFEEIPGNGFIGSRRGNFPNALLESELSRPSEPVVHSSECRGFYSSTVCKMGEMNGKAFFKYCYSNEYRGSSLMNIINVTSFDKQNYVMLSDNDIHNVLSKNE